jgi:hypothetical protein
VTCSVPVGCIATCGSLERINEEGDKVINPALFEVKDQEGKLTGLYNLKHLKPYLRDEEAI